MAVPLRRKGLRRKGGNLISPIPPGPPANLNNLQFSEDGGRSSMAEAVIYEWVTNFALLDAAILMIDCTISALLRNAGGGAVTANVYVGGTIGNVDGSLVASLAGVGAVFTPGSATGAVFAVPAAGATLVKVTIQGVAADGLIRAVQVVFAGA